MNLLERANPRWDYSAKISIAGGEQALRNWNGLLAHTDAEWSSDLDRTMATMTKDPFQIFHFTSTDIRGYDAVRAFYAERFRAWAPGQGFFAKRWVVTDEYAAGQGWFNMRATGPFFGEVATGKQVLLPISIWIYFEDGLVHGEASYADSRELVRQIREGVDGDISRDLY